MPLPYNIWMHLSAFHAFCFITARHVRYSVALTFGTYVLWDMLHLLWRSAVIKQLKAIVYTRLSKWGLCIVCRNKAMACRGCLAQLVRNTLNGVPPRPCRHGATD